MWCEKRKKEEGKKRFFRLARHTFAEDEIFAQIFSFPFVRFHISISATKWAAQLSPTFVIWWPTSAPCVVVVTFRTKDFFLFASAFFFVTWYLRSRECQVHSKFNVLSQATSWWRFFTIHVVINPKAYIFLTLCALRFLPPALFSSIFLSFTARYVRCEQEKRTTSTDGPERRRKTFFFLLFCATFEVSWCDFNWIYIWFHVTFAQLAPQFHSFSQGMWAIFKIFTLFFHINFPSFLRNCSRFSLKSSHSRRLQSTPARVDRLHPPLAPHTRLTKAIIWTWIHLKVRRIRLKFIFFSYFTQLIFLDPTTTKRRERRVRRKQPLRIKSLTHSALQQSEREREQPRALAKARERYVSHTKKFPLSLFFSAMLTRLFSIQKR